MKAEAPKATETDLIECVRRGADWLRGPATMWDRPYEPELLAKYPMKEWRGAIMTKYDTKTHSWSVFGTLWHTGLAIRAFLATHRLTGENVYLQAARRGADFLAANQNICPENPRLHGSLMSYEDCNDHYQTSTAMEGMLGWLEFAEVTGETQWKDRFMLAANWLATHAYAGEGLFYDHFDPTTGQFWQGNFRKLDFGGSQRPLLDHAIMLHAHRLSGDARYLTIFEAVARQLLKDENPTGTWMKYLPCLEKGDGHIHARQSYWWGLPLFDAYREFKDDAFLQGGIRAAEWYARHQNLDGGFYYYVSALGRANSFNLCTSACGGAMLLWLEASKYGRDFSKQIELSKNYILRAQFKPDAEDPNVRGGFFEKLREPDGSLVLGFELRDIAATFSILAFEELLRRGGVERPLAERT